RFVTGVSWVDGELWHATWEGDESELRRVDPQTGKVLDQLELPSGVNVSGLESNGTDLFFCGGGGTRKVRAVRRPKRRELAYSSSRAIRRMASRSSMSRSCSMTRLMPAASQRLSSWRTSSIGP